MPKAENETQVLDLSGVWDLSLSAYDGASFNDTVNLPGTLSENKKGSKNSSTDKTKLSLKYTYSGDATYKRTINIPSDWSKKCVTLSLERTKLTRVWVNGVEETDFSTSDSLAAPHEYYLENIVPGEENTIIVQVTNGIGSNETRSDNIYGLFRSKTHMLTAETQTDWNGIIGKIELKAADKIYIKDVMIYPDVTGKRAVVKIAVQNNTGTDANGTITLAAESYNHSGAVQTVPAAVYSSDFAAGESTLEYTYNMGNDIKLWSEFHPALYHLTASLAAKSGEKSDYIESFGMRDWGTAEGQFTINGKKTFLRGEANSAVFPENGYSYMTKEEWTEFFKKAQSMGINFFRFHSWTPPMAAFEAADELGIYMQPEMYGFGGAPAVNDFNNTLYGEDGIRILKYLASNPSFVMLTFGNEMTTISSKGAIEDYRARLKAIDSTRLYAEGTNNNLSISQINENDDFWTTAKVGMDSEEQHIRLSFGWNNDAEGGRLECEQPNSEQDYSKAVEYLNSDIPVIGHEVGQYQILPEFDEAIAKYEGTVFAPRNLSNFRSVMNSKGLLYMNEKFSRSTARGAAIQYRADIEAAIKTNNFGGYELLSIQDFPGQNTALVGILDSFMDDKVGGFTAEEYKSFNSPVTTLARIPKYMYNRDEDFAAENVTANYLESTIEGVTAKWSITDENGNIIAGGTADKTKLVEGKVTQTGRVSLNAPFDSIKKAQKLTFTVSAAGSTNSYSIWVYPTDTARAAEDLLIADAYTKEVRDTLSKGGKVLMLPRANITNLPNSVSVRWTNDYWSSMFHGRVADASTTMGIYLDRTHPVFNDFPTEFFGDYQWYNLMKNSRAVVLDGAPADFEPIVWNIDHMAYSKKLGSLFEAKVGGGKLLVCTMDILKHMDKHPEVRQMYNSLVKYASSSEFAPSSELAAEYLQTIFKPYISSADAAAEDIESDDKYRNPYVMIDPSNTSTGAVEIIDIGGSHEVEQLTVKLGGAVRLTVKNCDFGLDGSCEVLIGGSALDEGGKAEADIVYTENGGEKRIPVIFKNGEGKSFTLESGTTGGLTFWRNTITLPYVICGVQDIAIEFKEGTSIELADITFTDESKRAITNTY